MSDTAKEMMGRIVGILIKGVVLIVAFSLLTSLFVYSALDVAVFFLMVGVMLASIVTVFELDIR